MFFCPVRIIETESLETLSNDFKQFGTNCLIVTGRHSSKENGSLKDLEETLKKSNIQYSIFDKVEPNPTFKNVLEGVAFANNIGKLDFIIGLGGGSPMDAAKAIGILYKNPKYRVKDLYNSELSRDSLPLIMIPTTAGTGSEVTQYSVLTNELTKEKKGFASYTIFPKIAILNPKYQDNLPIRLLIDTGMDVLSHAIESILSTRSNWYSDLVAVKAIELVKLNLQKSVENISPARREMIRASTLAGVAIAQAGTIMIHAMGYPLTTFKDIPHGRANALLMPHVLRYLSKYTDRVQIIETIFDGLDNFESFIRSFVHETISLESDEIDKFSLMTMNAGNLKITPTEVGLYDLKELYAKI